MAQKSAETLNWRSSIVDLLKLVHLDSSLQSRKELAQELDFKGDTSIFNASPAISDGRLYLRSNEYLYCIGKK